MIFRLDDVLGGLKARRDRVVPENDVSGMQLSVCVEKNFGSKDSIEIMFVNQAEVGGGIVLIYRNRRQKYN